MASPAQCFYCFESLAASFKNEEPPSLAAIESSYWHFSQSKQLATMEARAIVEEEEDNEDEVESSNQSSPQAIKLPSVSRLQQDASSDSSSTTTLSANSSRSALSNSTNLTTPDDYLISQRNMPEESYPLFVTWNLISKHGHKSLRGCIGTFEAQKLSYGLKNYALISALEDTRFAPIPSSQLPSLSCALTLLSNFEPCADAMDWELGTHGLRISFVNRNRRYGSTYLPDVAVEQGWTKEETVESLMRKAGWNGGSDSGGMARRILRTSNATSGPNTNNNNHNNSKPWDEVSDFKATRYQGLQVSADYSDWQEWRRWVEADKSRLDLLLERS